MPAAPAAWIKALADYGTMSFGEVAQAAIRLTRDGFAMHGFMAEYIRDNEDELPALAGERGGVPAEGPAAATSGELFVQRELAATLQYMADEEAAQRGKGRAAGLKAARDAFYRGDIAQKIAALPSRERRLGHAARISRRTRCASSRP